MSENGASTCTSSVLPTAIVTETVRRAPLIWISRSACASVAGTALIAVTATTLAASVASRRRSVTRNEPCQTARTQRSICSFTLFSPPIVHLPRFCRRLSKRTLAIGCRRAAGPLGRNAVILTIDFLILADAEHLDGRVGALLGRRHITGQVAERDDARRLERRFAGSPQHQRERAHRGGERELLRRGRIDLERDRLHHRRLVIALIRDLIDREHARVLQHDVGA